MATPRMVFLQTRELGVSTDLEAERFAALDPPFGAQTFTGPGHFPIDWKRSRIGTTRPHAEPGSATFGRRALKMI